MSPVETLRAAAALLREIGAEAMDGPWETGGDGLVWARRMGDPVSGSTEPEDAAWIALVHPGLAEPLADWLDDVALMIAALKNVPSSVVEEAVVKPLAVARVLLGVPE